MTCNNAHFNYPRSASVSISMQITEVAILLEKKRKTNEDVKEEGRKRKRKWSGIMRKSEKNGNVGERKWRRKKGGGEIREIRGFKRGGPFQEILYFIYITEVRDYLFFSTRMLLFDTYLKLSWKKRIVRTTKVEIFTNEEKRWKIGGKKFREEI